MISFFSDGCLRDIVAKIQKVEDKTKKLVSFLSRQRIFANYILAKLQKVEDKTKKLVSFLSRQRIFANYILAKLQKNGSSNLMLPSKKR